MIYLRILAGTAVSALFTVVALAVIPYLFEKNSGNWALAGLIVIATFGMILGVVSGAIISGFQMNMLQATIFGAVFNLLIGIALAILTDGWTDTVKLIVLILILVGIINGAIVSLVSAQRRAH